MRHSSILSWLKNQAVLVQQDVLNLKTTEELVIHKLEHIITLLLTSALKCSFKYCSRLVAVTTV